MDQTYEEFEQEFLDDVRINAQIEGTTPDDYFFNDILGRLSSMGEIVDPQVAPMQKRCRNQKIMSFDAFAFDESDKSVVLITNDYIDDVEGVLNKIVARASLTHSPITIELAENIINEFKSFKIQLQIFHQY